MRAAGGPQQGLGLALGLFPPRRAGKVDLRWMTGWNHCHSQQAKKTLNRQLVQGRAGTQPLLAASGRLSGEGAPGRPWLGKSENTVLLDLK